MLYSPEVDYFYKRLLEDKIKDHISDHGTFLPEKRLRVYSNSVYEHFMSPNVAGEYKQAMLNERTPEEINEMMNIESSRIASGLGFMKVNEGYVLDQNRSRFLIVKNYGNHLEEDLLADYRERMPNNLVRRAVDGMSSILLFEDLNSRQIYENILREKEIEYYFEKGKNK